MKKLGVFGGTFNPIHKGHITAAEQFYDIMALDELLIIPANIPPHKREGTELPSAERLNMCAAAFSGYNVIKRNIRVSDIETRRNSVSYTYDTLIEIKEEYVNNDEGVKIYFLIGSDMFFYLDKWYRYRDLFKLCVFAVSNRYADDLENEQYENMKSLAEFYRRSENAEIKLIKIDFLEISSTQIRDKIKNNEDVSDFLSEGVYNYIKNNGLYT